MQNLYQVLNNYTHFLMYIDLALKAAALGWDSVAELRRKAGKAWSRGLQPHRAHKSRGLRPPRAHTALVGSLGGYAHTAFEIFLSLSIMKSHFLNSSFLHTPPSTLLPPSSLSPSHSRKHPFLHSFSPFFLFFLWVVSASL